ncbi:MAG TPA: COQ9 family protein [Rhizomicrobium sp.]|nr:COQ9 family protein [Rhizomicrobium sp.]
MSDGQEKAMVSESGEPSDNALKEAILKAALKDAAFDGFTDSVLSKAGKEAGADQAALARLFPEGSLSLIEYFSTSIDEAMEKRLAATELSTRKIRERIKIAVMTRLWLLEPHKEAARRAAATLSLPMHAALGAKLMYRSVDAIWRAAGDTSTDFNFYTKRAILAGVYGSVLVRWFSDMGEDDSATEAFLDARIENVMQFEKFKAKAKEALANFPSFAAWTKSPSK